MSKVSICIPTYEKVKELKRLLTSIYEQTFKDIEIVISDDSRSSKIKELVANYPEIKYLHNKKRIGATANNNQAMRMGTSEYIKIMHHDDWFTYKDSLQQMVTRLDADKSLRFVFGGGIIVNSEKSRENVLCSKEIMKIKKNTYQLYCANIIGGPSAIMLRKPIEYFDEKLCFLMDVEYFIRIIDLYKQMEYIEKPIISYGNEDNRLTNSCIANTDLIKYEYVYLYKKMNFEIYAECKETLVRKLVQSGDLQNEYEEFGITRKEKEEIIVKKIILANFSKDNMIFNINLASFWKTIGNYLISRKYTKISIYGYGEVGKICEHNLKNYVKVMYIIDRDKSCYTNNLKFYSPQEDMPKTDLTIVTINRNEDVVCKRLENKKMKAIDIKTLICSVYSL